MNYPNNAPEGIDTVSFQINERCVNKLAWSSNQKFAPFITLSQYGGMKQFFVVHVQCEALNPFSNYRNQIISIIIDLQYRSIIQLQNLSGQCSQYGIFEFIDKNLGYIAKLTALDFYFDFMRKDIIKYIIPNNYPTTNYSVDHERTKSLWIVYDRNVNLKRQRHVPYTVIDAMPYPMRIELRLRRQNCK